MDAVVVTHNSAEDLGALLGCRPLRGAFERLVVVDNGSSDATVDVARGAAAELLARENDSLSAGINAGVRACGGSLVAILNPDVLVDDGHVLAELEQAFAADPALGALAPALRLPDGSLQDSARTVPAPIDLVRRRLGGRDDGAVRPRFAADVPWVVGAFLVVRRRAFDAVGGFDPAFRLYFEDVDFCVRLWSAGWHVRFDPGMVARHEHQASSRRSFTGWAARQHLRSAARFYAKHPDLMSRAGRRRLVRPARVAEELRLPTSA